MKQYTYDEVLAASLEYFNNDQLAATTWINKYAKRDKDNNLLELTPDDMHKRLAKEFYRIESKYKSNQSSNKFSEYYNKRKDLSENDIYELFKNFKKIIPAGSVMSGLGSERPVSLSNCFVLPSPEDSYSSINLTRLKQTELMKRRGGVGYDLSNLRPRGASVNNAAITSTGAASFMDVCSDVTNEVAQQGRRGALMLSMGLIPDIQEFIEKKQDLTKVTGANVSVQLSDEFMVAVKNNLDFYLKWPLNAYINFELTDKANGINHDDLEYNKLYKMVYTETPTSSELKSGYMKKVKAKELWDILIHCAWNTAEPGILFKDRHILFSPDGVYDKYRGESTNPCVTGDTKVYTDNGELTVKEIVEKFNNNEELKILSYNIQDDIIEFNTLLNAQLTKTNTNIIEIEFIVNDGTNILKLTPDHKIYTINRGYIEAKDITTEDKIISYVYNDNNIVKYETNILQINEVNNDDVYDLTVEHTHNFFGNQLLIKNCGEIFMSGGESCRLLCINMLSFIDNPYTKDAKINVDNVYKITYEAMRIADDLVDLENEAVSKIIDIVKDDIYAKELWGLILEKGQKGRRVGLEFTALSDMIASLNLAFCSKEGNDKVKDVCKIMMSACLDCQTDMALERGVFTDYDKNAEYNISNEWYDFIKETYPYRYTHMMDVGRRNISFTTSGPCGTLSLLCGTSSGIEPLFMPYYVRRRKCMNKSDRVDYTDNLGVNFTEFIVVHPQLKKWAELNMSEYMNKFNELTTNEWKEIYEQSPWFNSCAPEIDWTKRVELQGIVQKYLISHSISSTVNLPNNVTEEEVSTIYMKAWENGLKGITVYRDGCRAGVMISTEKKDEPKKTAFEAKKRPKTLPCKVFRFTNKGEKWIGVVGILDGEPYEIFSGLQENLSIPNWVETAEIVKNKEDGHSRYDICYLDKEGYKVCIQGLSRIFNPEYWNYGKLISGLLRHHMEIKYIIKVVSSLKLDDSINAWKNGIIRTLQKFENQKEEVTGEVCPECGGKLLRESGCIKCLECGWSRCE